MCVWFFSKLVISIDTEWVTRPYAHHLMLCCIDWKPSRELRKECHECYMKNRQRKSRKTHKHSLNTVRQDVSTGNLIKLGTNGISIDQSMLKCWWYHRSDSHKRLPLVCRFPSFWPIVCRWWRKFVCISTLNTQSQSVISIGEKNAHGKHF